MARSLSQTLRAVPTEVEVQLWRLLFPFRSNGYHIRKQAQIGSYVVDFVCHHAKIVIEVDGGQHYSSEGQIADCMRDTYLRARGYSVIRFSNIDVMTNPDGVFMEIDRQLKQIEPRLRKAKS